MTNEQMMTFFNMLSNTALDSIEKTAKQGTLIGIEYAIDIVNKFKENCKDYNKTYFELEDIISELEKGVKLVKELNKGYSRQ